MSSPDFCLDVPLALGDICFQILQHLQDGTTPNEATLDEWLRWLDDAKQSHLALHEACEDVVEDGVTPERIAAIEQALACCQGQDTYWRRQDR